MKFLKWFLVFLYLFIILTFAFDSYYYEIGSDIVHVTGFEAIFVNQFYIIGNILMVMILLTVSYQIVVQTIVNLTNKKDERLHKSLIIISNIQLFTGIIMITFLGTFMSITAMLMIGLIVLNTFIKYKFNL